ncbi:MAG TPA: alanine racemase [Candidatus Binatia bacterium]|nr:alanine racemase [Candidatus Binatia bacterium]
MAARAALSSLPVARIDPAALTRNFGEVGRLVGCAVPVLAMIKSDAYGHGAVGCAEALLAAGCRNFGVVTIAEGAQIAPVIHSIAPDARVVIFGGILAQDAAAAVAAGAEVATQEISVVEALGAAARAAGTVVPIHIKLDTGMHRLGVAPADAVAFVEAASRVAGAAPVALCSHFAQAESVTGEVTFGQLERLLEVDQALRARGFALQRHMANSAAILTRKEAHLDMVRPGIMLYGIYPDAGLRDRASLTPVMTLEAAIVRVADVDAGEGISYGHTYRTTAPTRVATVRCGYADGYPRHLSNRGMVGVADRLAPVIGRVCMDHTMIDVSGIDGVAVGDRVTMWGTTPSVEEMAERAGTIGYELVARVGKRVERVFEERSQ